MPGTRPQPTAADPRVAEAERLARDLLAPTAARSDQHGVPRSHLDALGASGLLGLAGPRPAPVDVRRAATEHLAGGCGTTWFCWAQHHTPLATVAASANDAARDRWLDRLASGQALAGVAFAHVRRPGPPSVTATRDGGAWVLDGVLDWVTSWSICDVVLVVAQAPDDVLVRVLLEPHEGRGVSSGPPLRLAAMGGTWTCPVRLSGVRVPPEDVVAETPRPEWAAADAVQTVGPPSHSFGLTRAVVAALARTGEERGSAEAAALAGALGEELDALRAESYALADEVPAGEEVGRRLALRAHALELGVRASSALVAARAGGAMRASDPAQRWAREALFHLVQAQTADVRAATLRRYAQRPAR